MASVEASDSHTQEAKVLERDFLERALAIDPGFVSAVVNLGRAIEIEGVQGWVDRRTAYDEAFALYTRALEMDPNHSDAHAAIANYYIENFPSDLDLALEFGRKAINLDPNSFLAHNVYGRALSYTGSYDDAIRELQVALRLFQWCALTRLLWVWVTHTCSRDSGRKPRLNTKKF